MPALPVACLSTAAPFAAGDFGIDVREMELVTFEGGGLAQPWRVAVELQAALGEESGFTEVEAGERLLAAALAANGHHEE